MADSAGMSKSQKKRQRKAGQKMIAKLNEEKVKQQEEEYAAQPTSDPFLVLKEKLAQAKKDGKNDLARKIRQDIWVLQDTTAGHRPDLTATEVDESLNRIASNCVSTKTQSSMPTPVKEPETKSALSPVEKKIRSLEKKLQQIDVLRKKQESGEKLEKTQIAKIESEGEIQKEIEEMREVLASLSVTR